MTKEIPGAATAILLALSLLSVIGTTGAQNIAAPDFTLPVVGPNGLTGQSVSLSSFRGKLVFLEFMEPWCPHCQTMAQTIERLYTRYGSNVVFLSVAGPWNGATATDVARFIIMYGSTWTYLYDSSGTVMKANGVTATPTVFIVGNNGLILTTYQGEQSYETLAAGLTIASSQPYTATTEISNGAQSQTTISPQNVSLVVPPRYEYYFGFDLKPGDTEAFSFAISSWRGPDGVGFAVVSSTGSVLLDVGRVNQYSGNYTAIYPGRYYLRFDNSYSFFTTKTISLSYATLPPTLSIEEYQWSGNTITGYISNHGTSNIDTNNAHVSLNGVAVSNLGDTCSETSLNPDSSCSFSIAVPNGTWAQGRVYVLKLLTPNSSFSFLVVAGGNSGSVIQMQPNLITFQTVMAQTVTPRSENQTIFSADYFVRNAYEMIGVIAGGVLLITAIFGLGAISFANRDSRRGLYEERSKRTVNRRRYVPLLMTVSLAALGVITLSVTLPSLTNLDFASGIQYMLPGVLVLVLIASVLALLGLTTSILRGQRKNLRGMKEKEVEAYAQSVTAKADEIPIQAQQVKKRCRYCDAEVPREALICPRCTMPAGYI